MKRWPTASLGELAGGGQYGLNAAAMSEGTGVRFIRITDITQAGGLRHEAPAFVPGNTPELKAYELKDGDVLIARSGATAGKSYVHHSFGERVVFAGYLIRFRPDTAKILPRFIGAFLQTPNYWRQLNSHIRAVAQPNVNAKQLASLTLPVPPLVAQERIVSLLEEAEELQKLHAQADRRAASLIPALFHEMFGDPATNILRWPMTTLGELLQNAEALCDGDWVESKDQDQNGDVRLIQLADIGDGEYLDKSSRYLTKESASRLNCTKLEVGDVLVARMPDPLGRACVFPGDVKECVTVVDVCIIRPGDIKLDPQWLVGCINSAGFRNLIARYKTGTTRERISRGNLSKLPIPTPPLSLQEEFAQRMTEIRELEANQATNRTRLDALFQSMLHRAFNGEL